MDTMPDWLKPAGIFGIGLQSVFQLTDCIEFYTRQHNLPELLIALHSYGKSKGQIVIHEVAPNMDGLYYDNAIPGTNVKIVIDPVKIKGFDDKKKSWDDFIYYDPEFDFGNELDIIYAELCQVCKERIRATRCDYFNVQYREITTDKTGISTTTKNICLRRSYFAPERLDLKCEFALVSHSETIEPFINSKGKPFHFTDSTAYYWDASACRCYSLKVRPCIIAEEGGKQVFLPETTDSLYHVSYKFNEVSNTETIYPQGSRSRRTHAGFLEWTILILDGDPTKYLNIDRERLRDGAISEAELLEVRKKILIEWSDYFLSTGTANASLKSASSKKRFANNPGILLSLIILFYQNIPSEQFGEFMKIHQGYVENLNLTVGKEKIPFPFFWDKSKLFHTTCSFSGESAAPDSEMFDGGDLNISEETLQHFPHRMIRVESIKYKDESHLEYQFRFDTSSGKQGVEMDDFARLYDYLFTFEPQKNKLTKVDYSSIQKKVFKPDSKYPHLLLPCYPYTFSCGANFASYPDHCIRWYILSPFDKDATNLIRKAIRDEESDCEELMEYVEKSRQFKKCIQYICKKRITSDIDEDSFCQTVQNEYTAFITEQFRILCENREKVIGLFS